MKWACIQPLSGGMYFGAENAFGNAAEYIISFPGLDKNDCKKCPNEFPVLDYLTKHNKCPNYWQFKNNMFEMDINELYPEFINSDYTNTNFLTQESKDKKLEEELDAVVAVPVCSGLSTATFNDSKVRDQRNTNMEFITNFVLNRIKPKTYLFENAPTLFSDAGAHVRKVLEEIATKAGYLITYVKTDSNLHDNVQRRTRTFVMCWNKKYQKVPPKLNFNHTICESVSKYLKDKISSNATQNDPKLHSVSTIKIEDALDYQFVKQKYGDSWRKYIGKGFSILSHILDAKLDDEYYKFVNYDPKLCRFVSYPRGKLDKNMNFFDRSHKAIPDTHIPTLFHKTIADILHPVEDRFYTFREIMTFMGLPQDYEWPWSAEKFVEKIGQNVPALTARDMCLQLKEIVNVWNTGKEVEYPNEKNHSDIYFFNDIVPSRSYFK